MINERTIKDYCCEDISLIENYELAVNDTTQTWDCHHRRETIYSKKDLIEIGEYYNRPAIELIFLTKAEHISLHHKGNKNCLGKNHSKETKQKISKSLKDKKQSDERKKKTSEAIKLWWQKRKQLCES